MYHQIASEENRKRLISIIQQIPTQIPEGWTKTELGIGGLLYVGFSQVHTEKLICISAQGQSVIDCNTAEVTFCEENYDEFELLACAPMLGEEMIQISGEGGGGLRRMTKNGDFLACVMPEWPKEKVIFMPQYHTWYMEPEFCSIVFEDFEILVYGFSPCGKYFVVGTSHTLAIYCKQNP